MSIMTDDEKVEVLANTEIEKLTRLTKYYRVQNMILGTNMCNTNRCIYCEVCYLSPIWGEGGRFFILYIYLYVSENTIVDIHLNKINCDAILINRLINF
jgi:hypothetical protein